MSAWILTFFSRKNETKAEIVPAIIMKLISMSNSLLAGIAFQQPTQLHIYLFLLLFITR